MADRISCSSNPLFCRGFKLALPSASLAAGENFAKSPLDQAIPLSFWFFLVLI